MQDKEHFKSTGQALFIACPKCFKSEANFYRLFEYVTDKGRPVLRQLIPSGTSYFVAVFDSRQSRDAVLAELKEWLVVGIPEKPESAIRVRPGIWAIEASVIPTLEALSAALQAYIPQTASLPAFDARVVFHNGVASSKLVVKWEGKAPWYGKNIRLYGSDRKITVEGNRCLLCKEASHSIWSCTGLTGGDISLEHLSHG